MAEHMFQSSGNEEQDQARCEDIIKTQARIDDNVCPNGCALMPTCNVATLVLDVTSKVGYSL
jgi:hypothetical protein